jgi:uncharacterized membrane protein YhaH (DUF805 family)
MSGEAPSGFFFLYRSDEGRVTAAQWRAAAWPLAAIFAVTTAGLLVALPWTNRGLSERAFYDPAAIAANVYFLAYVFLTILIGISWVNLAAKRFRDRGRPAPLGLAGLMPLAALIAGASHLLQPRIADTVPRGTVWTCDAILIAVVLWTLAELFDLFGQRASD